jgi:hypothetical protein
MGFISRHEPPGPKFLDANEDAIPMLRKAGSFKFFKMFQGHNLQVTRDFSLNFNGNSTKIVDFILQLDEAIISKAMKLPVEVERWSKTKSIKDIGWSMFLTSSKTNYNHKGIIASMIKRNGNIYYGLSNVI